MITIVFVPGNGNSTTQDNWFPSVKEALEAYNIEVIAANFPDPELSTRILLDSFLT